MEQVRVGLIGAGFIASRHAHILSGFEDVHVIAIADPDVERARELAAPCGAAVYGAADEMFRQESLDAVYICVPPYAHGPFEAAALKRGIPFFVEKPLAADLATAEVIGARVAEQGIVTATGYHWRYLDITEHAQEIVRQSPARLALGYWLDLTPPPAWWLREAGSGGQLIEQTTHIFDLARLLIGEVTRVYATSSRTARAAYPDADVCDVSAVTLNFATGALGTLASSCLLHWKHQIGLHLLGEGLVLELSEDDLVVERGQTRVLQRASGNPFVCEDRDFIDTVQGKPNRIRAPYAEALRTHRLATAAARSAREERPIDLQPEVVHG